jgi:hypothetical protein
MSAASNLQQAIVAALRADTELMSSLKVADIFDRQVQGARLPYIVLDNLETTEWSTDEDCNEEHRVTLAVYSGENGRREVQSIMKRLRLVLHDAALSPVDARLVGLRVVSTEVRRVAKSRLHQGTMVLRAFTESA